MSNEIPNCLPPDRQPRAPAVRLPEGSIDTHVHVFEPGYAFSPDRGYTPPISTLQDLVDLHQTLGVDRVVLTQPSVYGVDNSAIIDAMIVLNARGADDVARAVVALSMDVTDDDLSALDMSGVRGVRLNTDNKGGMPLAMEDIPDLADRIGAFGWHIEFLFPGNHILDLMPLFESLPVPMSIGHFGYQPAEHGTSSPGFMALIELLKRGNTWLKISGANRVSATDLPPYDDVEPLVHSVVEAASDRIMWGTDWPHPNRYIANPNDADLVNAFCDWIGDDVLRRRIMVDTPALFYRF